MLPDEGGSSAANYDIYQVKRIIDSDYANVPTMREQAQAWTELAGLFENQKQALNTSTTTLIGDGKPDTGYWTGAGSQAYGKEVETVVSTLTTAYDKATGNSRAMTEIADAAVKAKQDFDPVYQEWQETKGLLKTDPHAFDGYYADQGDRPTEGELQNEFDTKAQTVLDNMSEKYSATYGSNMWTPPEYEGPLTSKEPSRPLGNVDYGPSYNYNGGDGSTTPGTTRPPGTVPPPNTPPPVGPPPPPPNIDRPPVGPPDLEFPPPNTPPPGPTLPPTPPPGPTPPPTTPPPTVPLPPAPPRPPGGGLPPKPPVGTPPKAPGRPPTNLPRPPGTLPPKTPPQVIGQRPGANPPRPPGGVKPPTTNPRLPGQPGQGRPGIIGGRNNPTPPGVRGGTPEQPGARPPVSGTNRGGTPPTGRGLPGTRSNVPGDGPAGQRPAPGKGVLSGRTGANAAEFKAGSNNPGVRGKAVNKPMPLQKDGVIRNTGPQQARVKGGLGAGGRPRNPNWTLEKAKKGLPIGPADGDEDLFSVKGGVKSVITNEEQSGNVGQRDVGPVLGRRND